LGAGLRAQIKVLTFLVVSMVAEPAVMPALPGVAPATENAEVELSEIVP